MTLEQISALGGKLVLSLRLFDECFRRAEARRLLWVYVKGQLSDLPHKTAEAIALRLKTAPRTLQRFLESIKWDEEKLRDRCQQIVAEEHAHPDRLSVEQVRSAMNTWLDTAGLPPAVRRQRFTEELDKRHYYQRRNRQARVSHTKRRHELLTALGIDVDQIKSCLPDTADP